ncbi:MAG: hypothetical protein L3K26_18945, partial [Candidatus Hydrogenedentes bacterium]|nr:hypothetical protein [Candidatus Hydrogenedentota bacterium]
MENEGASCHSHERGNPERGRFTQNHHWISAFAEMTAFGHGLVAVAVFLMTLLGYASLGFCAPTEGELALRGIHGFAEGVGFSARREALKNAQQVAMRLILETKVASGDLRPFRRMIRKADLYVTRIVELHLDTHGGQTQVEVDAYVDIGALEQDLATLALPRLAESPTLSCLIAIEVDGMTEVKSPGIAEEALVMGLTNLGLSPSPHTALAKIFKSADFHKAALGDVSAAAAYARETLADVV